ncbi:MAG: hypothetical protein HY815_01580 [Candidatus Riflebacteria bacterium]|nr:hypothetical protein [Candidatus Riflebacteria bacterium]
MLRRYHERIAEILIQTPAASVAKTLDDFVAAASTRMQTDEIFTTLSPNLRGLAGQLLDLELRSAFAVLGSRVALYRAAHGTWPPDSGAIQQMPSDPLTGTPLTYRLVGQTPVFSSRGAEGGPEAPDPETGAVLLSREMLARVDALRGLVERIDMGKLPELVQRPPLTPPGSHAPRTCEAACAAATSASLAFEQEFQMKLRPRSSALLFPLLVATGVMPGVPVCPGRGVLILWADRWRCSAHDSGPDPSVEWDEKTDCRSGRGRLRTALDRHNLKLALSLRQLSPLAQYALVQERFLARALRCPRRGGWTVDRATGRIECSVHGKAD